MTSDNYIDQREPRFVVRGRHVLFALVGFFAVVIAVNAVFIILFAELVRRWGPTFFAQFNYLAVVAAIGWAAIFFGEQPGIHSLIALALMATGVMISELRHRKG